jgi:hypothetical protein
VSKSEEPVDAEDPDDVEDVAAESTDPLKIYVIFMGVVAAVLVFLVVRTTTDRKAFEKANAQSQAIFGGPLTEPGQDERPTNIRTLAIGIQKYLQTFKEAKNKMGDSSSSIPVNVIRNIADGMGLSIKQIDRENVIPNGAKGYEEVSVTVQFETTDLERFANFLYNLESSSTKIRVLELKWGLMGDRDNPVQPGVSPGNRIQVPTAKFGFRRPIARK